MKKLFKYLLVLTMLSFMPAAGQARDFLNSVLHLNFGGMYTFAPAGNILDEEKSKIDTEIPSNKDVSHYETAYCMTLDIVPTSSIMFGYEEHAIKFGLRGSYRFHFLQQRVTTDVEIGDKVLDYRSWMIGPVIHYAPFLEPSDLNDDYTASGGFTFYVLYGRVTGDLTAYPSIRENNGSFSEDYETSIKGYKVDVGVGAEIALCSINVGLNVYYTYVNFTMGKEIYSGMGRNGYLKEGCLEIYFGIPIESFIDPIIQKF